MQRRCVLSSCCLLQQLANGQNALAQAEAQLFYQIHRKIQSSQEAKGAEFVLAIVLVLVFVRVSAPALAPVQPLFSGVIVVSQGLVRDVCQ